MRFGERDQRPQLSLLQHRTGRVVRAGDADHPRMRRDRGLDCFGIDLETGLEVQVDMRDSASDCARCFESGGLIGPDHDEMIVRREQGGRDDEQGAGRADRDQHVIG